MEQRKGNIQTNMRFPDVARYLVVLSGLSLFACSSGKMQDEEPFIQTFNKLKDQPSVVACSCQLQVNNNGGHLQGIQSVRHGNREYAVVTGSSDSYSYYAVIRLNEKNEVISVNKLMDKPFKHAGGFQVFQNWMAIGIEDNSAKDKSKVCIYDLSNPENPPTKPIATIERSGDSLRATAGCVGLTKYKDQLLIVVGGWDTKHLDFYSCSYEALSAGEFGLIFSINTDSVSKEGWVNKEWISYQNIHLFNISNNELFLVGLGQNRDEEQIADVFLLTEVHVKKFSLTKVASRIFKCENGATFRAGAGIAMRDDRKLQIVACSHHLNDIFYLNYFTAEKTK